MLLSPHTLPQLRMIFKLLFWSSRKHRQKTFGVHRYGAICKWIIYSMSPLCRIWLWTRKIKEEPVLRRVGLCEQYCCYADCVPFLLRRTSHVADCRCSAPFDKTDKFKKMQHLSFPKSDSISKYDENNIAG